MNEETLLEIIAWLRDPKIKSPMRKTWREVLANRLEKVASRAIELGDRELLEHMERMCLVERKKK